MTNYTCSYRLWIILSTITCFPIVISQYFLVHTNPIILNNDLVISNFYFNIWHKIVINQFPL